jgi:ABC-type nitrate/sulfonate/bicarbonate transport system permease component
MGCPRVRNREPAPNPFPAGGASERLKGTGAPFRVHRRLVAILLRLMSATLLLLCWILAARFVALHFARPSVVLPGPTEVIRDIPSIAVFLEPNAQLTLANAGLVIAQNTLTSALRLFLGLAVGTALGIGIALLLGWSKRSRLLLLGPLLLIRTIPLLALIPLFLAWFGGSEVGIVAFIAFTAFAILFVNTISAIGNVSPILQAFARTLGASRFRIYRTVVVPAIVPELAGGFQVVLGIAWAILLGGEYLEAQSGIGHLLILAAQFTYTSRMIVILILIMIYSFVVGRAFAVLARWLTRWMPD